VSRSAPLWGWPALAVALKPTLLPFALIGARRRSWWLVAGLGLVAVDSRSGACGSTGSTPSRDIYGLAVPGRSIRSATCRWLLAPVIAGCAPTTRIARRPGRPVPRPTEADMAGVTSACA
jgi:hypothetical protein